MAHVTARICHNCRLYRVPLLKSEISFAEWIIYVCQMDTSLLSLHTTAFKLPFVLTRMSPRFSLCVVVFRFLSLPFLRGLTVQQQQIVFLAKSSNRSGEEKMLSLQFVTSSLYSPRHICHCIMGCYQVLCHLPSVLTQVHIHVIRITSGVT